MSRRTRRRRAEACYGPETGTTYLLHFIDPATGEPARYKHAGHYIGWTTDLAARLDAHASGTGARLVEVITRAGLGFRLARTWPDTTRDREDLLKHIGDARRFCPECGVTPRQQPAVVMPEPRRSLYDLERDGTWLDGTPLPGSTPAWPMPAAHRKDAQMLGRQHRAAARDHAQQQARAQAEADALFAEADRLDDLTGQPHGYQQPITAERASRIRAQLGEDLARDALRQASPQTAEAPGPQFHGAERDAEIDHLAAIFPEPTPEAQGAAAAPDYYRNVPGSAEHLAAGYRREITADRAARIIHQLGEPLARDAEISGAGMDQADLYAPGEEPEIDAARWVPGQERDEREVAGELLSEHAARAEGAWRRERLATAGEHIAQLDHDEHALSWARHHAQMAREARASATRGAYVAAADMQRSAVGPELDDTDGRSPLPRILDPGQASPALAPVAATLADGTPHADPFLAGRGWQAQDGVYVRQPQAQLEAG